MVQGFGLLDKTVLIFDKAFWPPGSDFVMRQATDLSGRWSTFLSFQRLLGAPVLVALHSADTARMLEGMTYPEVVSDAMRVLRSMYPNAPQPKETRVTRWAADPYALGSYSYFAVGNPKNITALIAEPFGRVLFAGEATSDKPATVLGAHLSGLREAARVTSLLGSPAQ